MLDKNYKDKSGIVYAYENKGRVSLNVMLVNDKGEVTNRNNWTFDLLGENIFFTILEQIFKSYKGIKNYYFAMPGSSDRGVFHLTDFFEISESLMREKIKAYDLDICFINDVDAAVFGYSHEKLDEEETLKKIVGVFIPKEYPPGMGIYFNNYLDTKESTFPGEIKNMYPDFEWDKLYYLSSSKRVEVISQLLISSISLLAPDEFVVYSEYLSADDFNGILALVKKTLNDQFTSKIVLKQSIRDDLEKGMVLKIGQEEVISSV
ncbi:MAG: hypothetical protein N4A40_03075 [Tissierellales bacterium]|nr:hypothetical protein [Tissierellales bacterium]